MESFDFAKRTYVICCRKSVTACALLLRFGKILDRVIFAVAFEDGDADGIHVGVEDVGTMAGRVHPHGVNLASARRFGNVFREGQETDSSFGTTRGQTPLAGELMRDRLMVDHQ